MNLLISVYNIQDCSVCVWVELTTTVCPIRKCRFVLQGSRCFRWRKFLECWWISVENNFHEQDDLMTRLLCSAHRTYSIVTYQNCVPRPYQDNWRISNIKPIKTQFFNPIVFLRHVRTTVWNEEHSANINLEAIGKYLPKSLFTVCLIGIQLCIEKASS